MDWTIIQQALPAYGHGFVLTVWLSLVGIIGSIIVGVIASLLQYFKTPILSQIATAYVELARNTPLLIQLFFLYYAFPLLTFSQRMLLQMRLSKKRKRRSTISSGSFRIHISLLRDGTEMSSWKNSRIRSGMNCTNRVLRAEPVHLSARPASAMTSKITMQERTACRDTAAGIPVCTRISR